MSPDGVMMPYNISAAAMMEMLGEAVAEIRKRSELTPRVGIILGTGLGALGEEIEVEAGLSDGAMTEVRPVDSESLQVDDAIAIGLALDGAGDTAAPSLSLRGHR